MNDYFAKTTLPLFLVLTTLFHFLRALISSSVQWVIDKIINNFPLWLIFKEKKPYKILSEAACAIKIFLL